MSCDNKQRIVNQDEYDKWFSIDKTARIKEKVCCHEHDGNAQQENDNASAEGNSTGNHSNCEKTKQEKALEYALKIREFEIDLYWKRAAYFWTFIAVAFAGYFTVASIKVEEAALNKPDKLFLQIIIASLGIFFSWAWVFVNKGSKFWQENWENHVDLLEDAVIGPLYKVVIGRKEGEQCNGWQLVKYPLWGPGRYSVSKINSLISLSVVAVWILLLISLLGEARNETRISAVIVVCVAFMIAVAFFARTGTGNSPDLKANLRSTSLTSKGD